MPGSPRRALLLAAAATVTLVVGLLPASRYDAVMATDASGFDIDHLVPLHEAWQSGAHRWSARTHRAYANDLGYPASLVAVTASTNRSKSDREPGDWLPPRASYN